MLLAYQAYISMVVSAFFLLGFHLFPRFYHHQIMSLRKKFSQFFWKFDAIHLVFMFYVFQRVPSPALFIKVKNAPCPFLEVKNAPGLFSEMKISSALFPSSKLDSCWKSGNATRKLYARKNSYTQKQQILHQNSILFLHGEAFNKRGE